MLTVTCCLGVLGCVEPESRTTRTWCVDPEPQSFEMLDDMEDGDGLSCQRGQWSVRAAGVVTPLAGTVDLTGADLSARKPSLRALHLTGATDAGGSASLFVALSRDLSTFQEIQFWARSDSGSIEVRVNVATAATTDAAQGGDCDPGAGACGDHFGDLALITDTWGDQGNPNSIALGALMQTGAGQAVTKDLSQPVGLEFRVGGAGMPAMNFGLWVDDIRLKKAPGS